MLDTFCLQRLQLMIAFFYDYNYMGSVLLMFDKYLHLTVFEINSSKVPRGFYELNLS